MHAGMHILRQRGMRVANLKSPPTYSDLGLPSFAACGRLSSSGCARFVSSFCEHRHCILSMPLSYLLHDIAATERRQLGMHLSTYAIPRRRAPYSTPVHHMPQHGRQEGLSELACCRTHAMHGAGVSRIRHTEYTRQLSWAPAARPHR